MAPWLTSLALFLSRAVVAQSASCWSGLGNFVQGEWSFCQQVTPTLLMYFSPDGDNLKLGIFAEGHSGWSAIGLGGNGGMKGASQVVVRKNDQDEWVAEDRNSLEYDTPALDAQQDVLLMFAQENAMGTEWGVLLPLNSCDEEDYPIKDVSRWAHWALGSSHTFTYHVSRGQFHTNFISGPEVLPTVDGLEEFDLLMPNVEVVLGAGDADPTNPYKCAIFDMTQFMPDHPVSDKHHVVKFSPRVNQTTAQYVHHMILFGCNPDSGFSGSHGDVVEHCESMPRGCSRMMWPWAVGSQDVVLPADVGFPLGEGTRYYALQMHYWNPQQTPGVVDSSGVRLTIADAPRPLDAGIFDINGGIAPDMREALLPGQSNFELTPLRLPAACTNKWSSSINVIGLAHHAHLAGKQLRIDVSRGDTYVGPLRRERRYDFNHQSLEPTEVAELRRGDQIVFSCTYDTTSRTTETEFGDLTEQEMCWAALMYYPRQTDFRGGGIADWEYQPNDGSQYVECNGFVHVTDPIVPEPTCSPVGGSSGADEGVANGSATRHDISAARVAFLSCAATLLAAM